MEFINIITAVILGYFFLLNNFYLLLMVLSMIGIRQYRNLTTFISLDEVFFSPLTKPVSVILPSFNEEKNIVNSVKSLLSLEYPLYEVIVVNDGSTDLTLRTLIDNFNLMKSYKVYKKSIETKPIKNIYTSPNHPNLVVVDKFNGNKADALNAGLNISRYPLCCSIDSDSILEKDSLLKIVRPFLEDPEKVVVAGGIVRLSNGCEVSSGKVTRVGLSRNWFIRFQIIEYFRAFLGARLGLAMLNSILIISGAFSAFRKDIALKCGGYRTDTVTEDMDLVVKIQKYLREKKIPYKVHFVPDPICWTEGPEKLKHLARQRNRWHRGLLETLLYHFKMLFNPRYGITGVFAVPFYFLFETIGPLIELSGYAIFAFYIFSGKINYPFTLIFFLVAVIYGTLVSLMGILLGEYSHRPYPKLSNITVLSPYGILENIFYRQFITAFRVKAFFDYIIGKKHWGKLERKGYGENFRSVHKKIKKKDVFVTKEKG